MWVCLSKHWDDSPLGFGIDEPLFVYTLKFHTARIDDLAIQAWILRKLLPNMVCTMSVASDFLHFRAKPLNIYLYHCNTVA